MEKNRKQIRRIFWIVLILGSLVLGIGIAAFNLSDFVGKVIYISWVSVICLSAIIIDLIWYKEFSQKINEINLILSEQDNPDQYIVELNALMEGKRSFQLRQLHLINLGAAYIHKKDYEKAKDLFLQVKAPKLSKINKVIYWADLALIYFYLKEEQPACAIMAAQKNDFEQFKNDKQVGEVLAVIDVFYLIARGEQEEARQQLEEARKQWENPRNASDFLDLESLIADLK